MTRHPHFSAAEIQAARYCAAQILDLGPCLAPLVNQLIGRIADKWTTQVTAVLMDQSEPHVTQLVEMVEGASHKMRTQTLRQMERNDLLIRTVHPVVLPHVDYRLTHMRLTLSAPQLRPARQSCCGAASVIIAVFSTLLLHGYSPDRRSR